MSEKQYDGPERRKYFRYNIIYSPKKRATLKIKNNRFDVLDFSQGGLRFTNDTPLNLGNHIYGEIIFSDGSKKKIEGEIVWKIGDEVGVKYTDR